MSRAQIQVDTRKRLVERVAASRYFSRSARLRSLLMYLCDKVLEDGAQEIHEQEVGHAVFGRAVDYDTTSDNIVRVHASLLRKRLEQYFLSEGRHESLIIELPKGNYAPVFTERPAASGIPDLEPIVQVLPPQPDSPAAISGRLKALLFVGIAVAVAVLGLALMVRHKITVEPQPLTARHGLWSQMFVAGAHTDVVLDDGGIGLYQELTGKHVALSDYFNRNYLRTLGANTPKAALPQADLGAIVVKRQSSYASANLLWKLGAIAAEANAESSVHFARDYSFRELQVNNAILIGNAVSNPWIEAFQGRIGLRWKYDAARGAYYPIDAWAPAGKSEDRFPTADDGYATVALVPNLKGTGTVLILSSSGGSAMNTAADFLADNGCVRHLNSLLPAVQPGRPQYFEALLRMNSRSRLTRDTSILICRKLRM